MSDQPPRIRVDWTVPIWGVLGLVVQGIGIVWFVATLNQKVDTAVIRLDKLENRVSAAESASATIARLDERTRWIYDAMQREDTRPR